MFWYLKILAEHEREELLSTSGENIEQLLNAEETLPAVVEAATQTRNTGKNVSVQFRSSRTAKGKFGFSTQCCVIEKWNHHRDNFPCISSTQRKNNSVQKYLYRLSNVHRPKKSGNPMHSSQRIFHDFHPSPKWRVVRQWRWNGARWWPFIRPWPRRDACRCRW